MPRPGPYGAGRVAYKVIDRFGGFDGRTVVLDLDVRVVNDPPVMAAPADLFFTANRDLPLSGIAVAEAAIGR